MQLDKPAIMQSRIKDNGDIEYIERCVPDTRQAFVAQKYNVWTGKYVVDAKGNPTDEKIYEKIDIFKEWIESKDKLVYESRVFNPIEYGKQGAASNKEFNNFTGFDYKPTEKYSKEKMEHIRNNELKPFFDHIQHVWCNHDILAYNYIKLWLGATVIQPSRKLTVAIVLKSLPGAGKGTIIGIIKQLTGKKYLSCPTSLDDITTKEFNSFYLESCLLMFLDECFYVGDKKMQKALMKLTTEDYINVSKKFKSKYSIDNLLNIIMATNEDHALFLQRGQRRNFVIECLSDFIDNDEYFTNIRKTDLQLLMNYFYSMEDELQKWRPEKFPQNDATMDQQIRSFSVLQNFLINTLNEPEQIRAYLLEKSDSEDELSGLYDKKALYEEFYKSKNGSRYNVECSVFWKDVNKICPSITTKGQRKQFTNNSVSGLRAVLFPNLTVARSEFKKNMRMPNYKFDAYE
jgi:putative DNA primase/helicase